MSLIATLQKELTSAMKEREAERRDALRLILSSLQSAEKELQRPLTEDEELQVLQRERKRRLESIEAFVAADRPVQAAKEEGELGVLETDGDARGHVDGRAQLALDLGRGEGESLERPPCPHAERGGTTGGHRGRGLAREGVESHRHFVRAREVRHPEQVAQPPLRFRPGHVVGEIDAQAAGQDVNTATQIGQEPAGVPAQPVHEDGTVAALQRDLVVAEDDVHLRQ